MSDGFSWAPFGSDPDDDLPPLPPLPRREDDDDITPSNMALPAMPTSEEISALDYVSSEPPPSELPQFPDEPAPPPPAMSAWSSPPPPPTAPSIVGSGRKVVVNLGQGAKTYDLGDMGQLAQQASASVGRELREGLGDFQQQLDAPGTKEAGQALLWGILGLTFCPFLLPSIMAVVYGNRAQRATTGLAGRHSRGSWGIALGWIGIILWAVFAVLIAIGAAVNV